MCKNEDVCPRTCLFLWVYKIRVIHSRRLQVCSCSLSRFLIQISSLLSESDCCGISQWSGMPPVLGMLFHKFQHAVLPYVSPVTCCDSTLGLRFVRMFTDWEEASLSFQLGADSDDFGPHWTLYLWTNTRYFQKSVCQQGPLTSNLFYTYLGLFRVHWPFENLVSVILWEQNLQ